MASSKRTRQGTQHTNSSSRRVGRERRQRSHSPSTPSTGRHTWVCRAQDIRTGNGGGLGRAKVALDVGRLTSFEPGFHFRGSVVSSHDLIYPENEDVEEYGNDCSLLEYAGEGEWGAGRGKGKGEGIGGGWGRGGGRGSGERGRGRETRGWEGRVGEEGEGGMGGIAFVCAVAGCGK